MGDVPARVADDVLVGRVHAGEAAAFDCLAREHAGAVRRVALRMVGPDAADDVVQGALLRAWTGLPRFAGDAAFATWLHRIAVNLCLDHRRAEAARARTLALEAAHGLAAPDGDPADLVATR